MRSGVLALLLFSACTTEVSGLPDSAGGVDASVQSRTDARLADSGADPGTADAGAVGTADAATADAPGSSADAGPATGVKLVQCTGRAFPAHQPGQFAHFSSEIIAALRPEHAGYDVLTSGGPVSAAVRMQYGSLFADLGDESVRVYLDDCSGWKLLGTVKTDDDGRASWSFGELAYGVYDVRWEVVGDATTAPAQLWVLPRKTHLTLFDIDGTLTTSDFEVVKDFFFDIVSGDYVPEAYPGAVDLTGAYREIGAVGIYLTGRPYWLTRATKEWLKGLGFAPGPLFLARSTGEALPTVGGVGTFKLETLKGFDQAGFRIDGAQGNATTDIYAYLNAGVPATSVWIIGAHGGEAGTNAVTDSWAPHVAEVMAFPEVKQPFEW